LIEEGPDMFFTKRPWALNLSKRLNLDQDLIETNENNRGTFVLWQRKLVPVPEGFLMLAPSKILPFLKTPLFSWQGKLRMLMDLFISKKEVDDESLASFVRRRFGNEALERIAQPMIGGIYTADPEKLSLRATMPQFLELEEKYGSVIKGMSYNDKENEGDTGARYSHFLSFKNGMKTLINTIESKLPEDSVNLGETVKGITPSDRGWKVLTQKRTIDASAIIITTPSYHAASLIQNFDPSLGSDLLSIEYASSAVIILAYKREDISHDLNGFGFVVPDIENSNLIACSFSSIKFEGRAPQGYVLLRAFVGGALNPGICDLEDTILIQEAEKEVSQILGISSAPEFTILKRYPQSMPQYHVGHLQIVEKIKEKLNHHQCLEIAGNAYSGVGIPDCVHSGEQAAEGILKELF
ncbi:MAG: protoporphyrinogen oxidase, partial [Candidatus Dadabacteria bacterium]|nr:protoporphyrinogen oxidase [Candidatus Dadabacteria bacterium]